MDEKDLQLERAIEAAFTYHPPKPDQVERYNAIRDAAKKLALGLNQLAPFSREKLVALDRLREAVFWINAAIAVNEAGE